MQNPQFQFDSVLWKDEKTAVPYTVTIHKLRQSLSIFKNEGRVGSACDSNGRKALDEFGVPTLKRNVSVVFLGQKKDNKITQRLNV